MQQLRHEWVNICIHQPSAARYQFVNRIIALFQTVPSCVRQAVRRNRHSFSLPCAKKWVCVCVWSSHQDASFGERCIRVKKIDRTKGNALTSASFSHFPRPIEDVINCRRRLGKSVRKRMVSKCSPKMQEHSEMVRKYILQAHGSERCGTAYPSQSVENACKMESTTPPEKRGSDKTNLASKMSLVHSDLAGD